jgi:hypothetical protein
MPSRRVRERMNRSLPLPSLTATISPLRAFPDFNGYDSAMCHLHSSYSNAMQQQMIVVAYIGSRCRNFYLYVKFPLTGDLAFDAQKRNTKYGVSRIVVKVVLLALYLSQSLPFCVPSLRLKLFLLSP